MQGIRFSLAAAVLFTVVACVAPSARAADNQEIGALTIRFASIMATGDPMVDTINKFKELVEKNSGGKMKVMPFVGGVLGDERTTLEALRTGSLQMAASSALADAVFFAPEYNIFSTPYLIKDMAHARRVWASDVGKEINDHILSKFRIRTLAVMDRGTRELTSNTKVVKPDDLKGLKLRLPQNEVYLKVWGVLGATPVAVALTEVYTSLQTGVVTAQENPLATIVSNKFQEVQKYCMLTHHIIEMYKIQCSGDWYAKLSEPQKKIIEDALVQAVEFGNKLVAEREGFFKQEMLKSKVEFVEVDTQLFKDKAMDTIKDLGTSYFKAGLMDKVLAID